MIVSYFQNTWDTSPKASVDIIPLFERIRSGKHGLREAILDLRSETDPEKKKELKKRLGAVTWSGTFSERKITGLIDYSGILCVDIDHITKESMESLFNNLAVDQYVLGVFQSPSGDGLKVLLYSSECSVNFHQQFYFSAEKYFKDTYKVQIDRACKDVSRLCYLSYDPKAILFEKCVNFPIDWNIKKEEFFVRASYSAKNAEINKDVEYKFAVAKKWVERIFIYEEGSRNKYLHNLACTLNRLGVTMDNTIALIDKNYVTPDRKWIQSMVSAYKHNAKEFNTASTRSVSGDKREPVPYIESPYKFGDIERQIRDNIVEMLKEKLPVDLMKSMTELHILVYRNMLDSDLVEEIGVPAIVDYMINSAKEEFKTNELNGIKPISSQSVYELGAEIENSMNQISEFVSGVIGLDPEIPGLFCRGNCIGLIGREKTFKSVLAHVMAYENAKLGIPSLYLNGEMSKPQFVKRSVIIDSGTDFDHYLHNKEKIPSDVFKSAMDSLEKNVGKNLQVHSDKNFNRDGIRDLITKFRSEGMDIQIVFVDGLSQCEDVKNDEIKSAIYNAGELKELAKEANVLVIVLMHVSGRVSKSIRNTGEHARGGIKTIANYDAYISTSLFEVETAIQDAEPEYKKGVFCIQIHDKRGVLDVITKAVNVGKNLKLILSENAVEDYEF